MARAIIIFLFSCGILFPPNALHAAAPVNKIRAAYIYQFSQFVTWPPAQLSSEKYFTICVLGNEPLSDDLAPLNRRQLDERLIKVISAKTLHDSAGCSILYIAKTEQPRLQDILDYFQNKPVLTVSSIPNFAASGGIIGFIITDNKVRLEINRASALHANITISAKLLEIARLIKSERKQEEQP